MDLFARHNGCEIFRDEGVNGGWADSQGKKSLYELVHHQRYDYTFNYLDQSIKAFSSYNYISEGYWVTTSVICVNIHNFFIVIYAMDLP